MDIKTITLKSNNLENIVIDLRTDFTRNVAEVLNKLKRAELPQVIINKDNDIQTVLFNSDKSEISYQLQDGLVITVYRKSIIRISIIENNTYKNSIEYYDNFIDIELNDSTHMKLSNMVSMSAMTYNLKDIEDIEDAIFPYKHYYKTIEFKSDTTNKIVGLNYKKNSSAKNKENTILFSSMDIKEKPKSFLW